LYAHVNKFEIYYSFAHFVDFSIILVKQAIYQIVDSGVRIININVSSNKLEENQIYILGYIECLAQRKMKEGK